VPEKKHVDVSVSDELNEISKPCFVDFIVPKSARKSLCFRYCKNSEGSENCCKEICRYFYFLVREIRYKNYTLYN
jgi:hypothetical protein